MHTYKIGKPSHATGIHPDTRIEPKRFGGSTYHCPCGKQFFSLASIRKHVKGVYKNSANNCSIILRSK